VMDSLASGKGIKRLTVVDNFTRECLEIAVDIGGYLANVLDRIGQFRGCLKPCGPTRARSLPVRSWTAGRTVDGSI
jgi:putative transposase